MSDDFAPLVVHWDGEAMVPIGRFKAQADRDLVVGEKYIICEYKDRSGASHRHYFAMLREYWQNLHEDFQNAPWAKTPEHLRAYALIKTGWCKTNTAVFDNEMDAQKSLQIASWVAGTFTSTFTLSYVTLTDDGTYILTSAAPLSQSYRAMGKDKFQKSKDDVLNWCQDLIEGRIRG